GDGGLAGARESREPQHAGSLSLLPRACLLVDVHRLPVHVLRAAQSEVDQPGADGVVGEAVDEDEAAESAILAVGLERDRPVELELAHADVVELEPLGGGVLERVDVDLVLERARSEEHTSELSHRTISYAVFCLKKKKTT